MKRTLLASSLFCSILQLSAQDQCATALPITAGSYVVTSVNGSEMPSPDCFGNSTNVDFGEWYTYTPDTDLGLKITSDLLINSGGDTRFHIYTGTCGQLVCVGGDDDDGIIGNGYLSIDSLNVSAGVTYTIVWDDRWSTNGFTFELSEGPEFEVPFGFSSLANPTEGRVLAAVDMNNDGRDDIVTVDSTRIIIHFQQANGQFDVTTFTTTEADFEPSWSLCAGDIDGNGHNDLVYGGQQGVTMMMANGDGTGFNEVSYPQYVFCQRSNMVDINNDGNLDVFMCHDVDPNVFYINDGNGNLTYNQGGLGDNADGGNYGSIWIDFDNDRDLDLFIAKCRGGESLAAIDQMHRNNGDGTFTEVAESIGLANGFHQSWSSAWGDFDRDGDLDVVVGASSSSFGLHKVFRNDGAVFTDVSVGSGIENFEGLSTEWTTHDFNNDGRLDILGGGRIHLGTGDLTFEESVSVGNHAIGDLNNDGSLDILSGSSIRLNNGTTNNWLRVKPVGTVSNKNGIGARILVTTALGTQIREIRSGDGFRYMSSLMAHFGLGTDDVIEEIRVLWPSGLISIVDDAGVNGTVEIVEGVSTGISTAEEANELLIRPNPATDRINVDVAGTGPVLLAVFSSRGERVMEHTLNAGTLEIGHLAPGAYILQAVREGKRYTSTFTKH